jgi:hypothetical protein
MTRRHKIFELTGDMDERHQIASAASLNVRRLPSNSNIKNVRVTVSVAYNVAPVRLLEELVSYGGSNRADYSEEELEAARRFLRKHRGECPYG